MPPAAGIAWPRRAQGEIAGAILIAHVGMDRAVGYGLKLPTSFQDTHLGRMGKHEGTIIDVIERATNRFVGVYFEQAGMGMVQIDGKNFGKPVYVGDPGAKGVQPEDKVVIEMVHFPSQTRDGEGVIVEVLGPRGQVGVDMSIITNSTCPANSKKTFDDSQTSRAVRRIDRPRRRDLTTLPITRPGCLARRRISLERADKATGCSAFTSPMSHFVEPKTPLDREALDRATSVYLPDRVIPMLPEIISNNLASLQPNKVRYALSAMMEFTEEGVRVATDVFKSAIKSRRRFTYEEVDEYLAAKLTPAPSRPHSAKRRTSRKASSAT